MNPTANPIVTVTIQRGGQDITVELARVSRGWSFISIEDENGDVMKVQFDGVRPGNFDQATSVVLKGKPNDEGAFVADQILVKCPSKYQGEDGKEYQDMKKHDEAVEGTSDA